MCFSNRQHTHRKSYLTALMQAELVRPRVSKYNPNSPAAWIALVDYSTCTYLLSSFLSLPLSNLTHLLLSFLFCCLPTESWWKIGSIRSYWWYHKPVWFAVWTTTSHTRRFSCSSLVYKYTYATNLFAAGLTSHLYFFFPLRTFFFSCCCSFVSCNNPYYIFLLHMFLHLTFPHKVMQCQYALSAFLQTPNFW